MNDFKYNTAWIMLAMIFTGCHLPKVVFQQSSQELPDSYNQLDTLPTESQVQIDWREYFDDSVLISLVDTALRNNQELNIVFQELIIGQNEVLERSGEYLPFVGVGVDAGAEKAARFTRDGAVEHSLEIDEGKEFPEPLGDFQLGFVGSWEVDIWRKLKNARDAAQLRYLAAHEGKNFVVSNLVAEVAESYYEVLALNNLLDIINNNASIQEEALRKVQIQKQNAKANQLAVNRFEAQWIKTKNLLYSVEQQLVEANNRIQRLTGGYSIALDSLEFNFLEAQVDYVQAGIPSELLLNRPDIREAELRIQAANLDVKSARAEFLPSLDISAGLGFKAFNPSYLINPESIIFNLAGGLTAPLLNRRAIRARFNMASASQIQSVLYYDQTVLQAYTDVLNQLARIQNYSESFATKKKEVDILNESVKIANSLFRYAKADYVEVLLTQEEVLEAKMELVETKLLQLQAKVGIYRALGGGWR